MSTETSPNKQQLSNCNAKPQIDVASSINTKLVLHNRNICFAQAQHMQTLFLIVVITNQITPTGKTIKEQKKKKRSEELFKYKCVSLTVHKNK